MRVLLIRLSSLGDVVLATSAVEALAARHPGLEIHFLTKPAFEGVFQGNPHLAELHLWAKGDSPRKVAENLKPYDFTLVVDLHSNLRTRLLKFFLPGRWSVYRKDAAARRLAVKFGLGALIGDAPHVTRRYARALRWLGVKKPGIPRLYVQQRDIDLITGLLVGGGWDGQSPLVALAPGARWATKAWPEAKWAELLKLMDAGGGRFPVLTGGAGERELCSRILGGAKGLNLAGETTIPGTAALLSLCDCLVTSDSAPMHIAGAVSTPVVAIFGPTVKGFGFFPQGAKDQVVERQLSCRPCSLHGSDQCPRGHFECMEKTDAPEVLEALDKVLGGEE